MSGSFPQGHLRQVNRYSLTPSFNVFRHSLIVCAPWGTTHSPLRLMTSLMTMRTLRSPRSSSIRKLSRLVLPSLATHFDGSKCVFVPFVQPPIEITGKPGDYASLLFMTASMLDALDAVENDFNWLLEASKNAPLFQQVKSLLNH